MYSSICRQNSLVFKRFLSKCNVRLSTKIPHKPLAYSRPDINLDFLESESEMKKMEQNAINRGRAREFQKLQEVWKKITEFSYSETDDVSRKIEELQSLWDQMYLFGVRIPNLLHKDMPIGDEPKTIKTFGVKSDHDSAIAEPLINGWNGVYHPLLVCGERSYTLMGVFSEIERALLSFAYQNVVNAEYMPITVPDVVRRSTTEACGVEQKENHSAMQYILTNEENLCLSGTAEMGIADLLRDKIFDEQDLPLRLVAQSRCFRPEISKSNLETKLYRVHEFTKVEMFVICKEEESDRELDRILDIQTKIFEKLGLYCRVLDMPSNELGASASRKYDIEAWMPGRKLFGEVSSASNCTDFQSRRLSLRYRRASDNKLIYSHTCNGTAIASSRAFIALVETHQQKKMLKDRPMTVLNLPEVLGKLDRSGQIKIAEQKSFKYNR